MAKKASSPIPPGCHTVTPHLICANAGKAIEFYTRAFGAKEHFRMPGPDGKSVMHAEVQIGDSVIFLADENPAWECKGPKLLGGSPVTIHMYVPDCDATFKQATAAGAEVAMPLTDMFWGDRYGKLIDPFGHHWAVATHKEDLTPQEIGERGQKAMAEMCKQG